MSGVWDLGDGRRQALGADRGDHARKDDPIRIEKRSLEHRVLQARGREPALLDLGPALFGPLLAPPEPARAAIIKAASTGPSSRTNTSATTAPSAPSLPKRRSVL